MCVCSCDGGGGDDGGGPPKAKRARPTPGVSAAGNAAKLAEMGKRVANMQARSTKNE